MLTTHYFLLFFFFNDTATTEIYTLSLHDALPIFPTRKLRSGTSSASRAGCGATPTWWHSYSGCAGDRKSTRLNSSHSQISYAVFCLKKKKIYSADVLSGKCSPHTISIYVCMPVCR